MTKFNQIKVLGLIIALAFLIRILNLSFPLFTLEEARIAFRGYTLALAGKDEFGKVLPLLFNSLEDYQLPLTSYVTALGIFIFGKSDLGARLPFVLIGTGIVFLVYKISQIFNPNKTFMLLSAMVVALSPVLIFLSKTPNESIILAFILTLIFYLLTKENVNKIVVFGLVLLSFLVSKSAIFITPPFVALTIFIYQDKLSKKEKIKFILICIFVSILATVIFLQIPQAKRSIMENNFSLFSDVTIKNGIERLRGQGVESGWPSILEKLVFNKIHYLFAGLLHWLSQLEPAVFFAQFDNKGQYSFFSMGAWPKIAIIPFLIGLVAIIKINNKKYMFLLGYLLILTYPLIFIYPGYRQDFVVITLPFMALVIAFGLFKANFLIRTTFIVLMALELGTNMVYQDIDIKSTNSLRPNWIKPIISEGFEISQRNKVAFSDDITPDIVPFLAWYTKLPAQSGNLEIPFPYKFRQSQIGNVKIIGSNENFYNCGVDQPVVIFASKRDLENIQKDHKINPEKVYKDSLGVDVAYMMPPTICVK